MTRWSCRHAAHVIAVSEQTRQDVIDLFGIPPEKVTTVHNGVGGQFKPLPEEQIDAFRRQKGLEEKRVSLYLGTLEPRKNIPALIGAFATLLEDGKHDDCVLAIGGSKGWYYDEIFASAQRLGLAQGGKVRFLGRVPDEELPLWYNSAAAFAYPSLYEGFGLPVLEAMSCGTPVIAANTSAFPEVVGDAGLLVDPRDEAAWCRALSALLDDKSLASKLSALARKQASNFSWQQAAEETSSVYDRVLTRTRNGK
jgi:glycosyltransferase involved in cell wall biosynthesis